MSCPVCGAQNEAGAAFCYRCGSALKPAESATGRTVNLGRDTPPFGTPAAQPQEDVGARVYDVPTSAGQPAATFAEPSATTPVSVGTADSTITPQFNVPQYNVPQPSGAVDTMQRPSSNTAVISMVLGIVSLGLFGVLLCTVFLSPISVAAGIPAVIVGRNARKEIEASGGAIGGAGMATAGIVMGWINIALSILAALAICGFIAFAAASS